MEFGVWKTVVNDKENYICLQCDYITNKNSNLTRHNKRKHLKEKNKTFKKCDKCDYTLKQEHGEFFEAAHYSLKKKKKLERLMVNFLNQHIIL